jgi:PKD repeat protein
VRRGVTHGFVVLALATACPSGGGGGGQGDTSSDATASSSGGDTSATSSDTTSVDTGTTTGEPEPFTVDAGDSRYAFVGDEVLLDGSGSTGVTAYQWFKDDGTGQPDPSAEPTATVTYDEPGRYRPVLTVYDAAGNKLTAQVTITVTEVPSHTPVQSGSIALEPGGDRFAVVSPDSDELAILRHDGRGGFALVEHRSVCDGPRNVSWSAGVVAVACPGPALVHVMDAEGAGAVDVAMPRASRPFGVIARDDELFVTLQGTAQLARIAGLPDAPVLVERVAAIADARGAALLPDGRIAVSRWRSRDDVAELALVDPEAASVEVVTLAFDPKEASDTEAGGIPSYLDAVLVSPQGDLVAVPSLQANFGQGEFLDGSALVFDETLRGVVSYLEIEGDGLTELFELRKHFDNRGLMTGGVFSSRGDFLFVADRGSRSIERVDVFTGGQAGALLDVGLAPQGLALLPDDRHLLVDAYMSRELVVFDVGDFSDLPRAVARLPIASAEPLPAELLLGKQLFNDAFDPRLARDGYIACAHCHLDGESDHRTWDFTDRGEGLRNTISLLGRGGDDHGPIHWSANFDEIQDFEHDIRNAFGGTGLMSDDDLAMGTRSQTLGDPKAGVSADLDALAAYVASLDAFLPSPHRDEDGGWSDDALAGEASFAALGCADCHDGPRFTDSVFESPAVPLLHDVGTIGPGSGQRLGGPLTGLDTPTLRELWNSPPYLHDGRAATLRDVFAEHNAGEQHGATASLSTEELDQLVAYLLSLE